MVLLFKIKIEPFFGGVYPEKIQWLLKLTTIYYTGGPSGGPLRRAAACRRPAVSRVAGAPCRP